MVSREIVDKLKLENLSHVELYSNSLENNSKYILVKKQEYGNFNISEDKDRELCDVIQIECFHSLLGRP